MKIWRESTRANIILKFCSARTKKEHPFLFWVRKAILRGNLCYNGFSSQNNMIAYCQYVTKSNQEWPEHRRSGHIYNTRTKKSHFLVSPSLPTPRIGHPGQRSWGLVSGWCAGPLPEPPDLPVTALADYERSRFSELRAKSNTTACCRPLKTRAASACRKHGWWQACQRPQAS